MSKLERAQELLSNIEDYLRNTLANEKLSASAQIKRRHLLDKFYALELQANVEHKPGTGAPSHSADSHAPLQKKSSQSSAECCKHEGKHSVIEASNEDEDLYEEPVACGSDHDATSDGRGSDTEYESYDDEDDDEDEDVLYINQSCETVDKEEIHLPKSKKRAKDNNVISSENTKFTGELYRKGLLSWTKCYCILTNQALVCYRAGKDSKVLVKIPTSGHEFTYLEKDGKNSHVIRISHPGSEVHWFYADSKETAEMWQMQLAAVGCKASSADQHDKVVPPAASSSSSTASAAKSESMDSVLGSAASTDGQANLSGGSSEGSGDGVIQGQTASATIQAVDKRKKSKLGESLQTLLGTFGKKKGDKLKRALNEACALDPDTHAAGYVNIYSELAEGKKWVKRFCVVKNNRLDCYKDPLDEYIEFSLALVGAQVDLVDNKSPKKIKIVQDVKEVLLSAFVEADCGRWLGILLRESGYGAQLVGSHRNSTAEMDAMDTEGIYDEVYNWEVYDIGEKQSIPPPPLPPPLPRGPPPKTPPLQHGKLTECPENDYIEPKDLYEQMFDDNLINTDKDESLGLEEALNSAFFNIRDGLNKRESSPGREQGKKAETAAMATAGKAGIVRSASQSPASKHKDLTPRRSFPVSVSAVENITADEAQGVVKCHIGPTIAEDKELLEATQNPILIELRKEKQSKGSGKLDKSKLEEKIEELRREYEEIKKKRSAVRGSLQTVESSLEKAQLEKEIVNLDKQLEVTDKEVTKLSILAQEIDGKSFFRNESFRSSSTGRGTSDKGSVLSPTFIHVSRNSSLRETSTSVHRTTSSGSLDHRYNVASSSSSPLQVRKLTLSEKRSSFSDTVPLRTAAGRASLDIETRTVLTTRSGFDNKGTSSVKTSSLLVTAGTRPVSQISSSVSKPLGDEARKVQDAKDGQSISVTRSLSACVSVRERLAQASELSQKTQPTSSVKNRIVETVATEARPGAGKVVQEKLKLWESLSDTGAAS